MKESAKPQLAVVMPVYNEENCIAAVINKWTAEFQRLNIDFQIHAYDDGSKDETLRILTDLAKKNRNLFVHKKLNSGHGPTISKGYRENCNAEWIFQIDSDDEIGTEAFEELWEKRTQYDFLIGRRNSFNSPLSRRVTSFMSRLVVRIFYGSGVYDVNLPYRIMKSDKFKELFLALPDNMFAPNVVVSGVASLTKMSIYEYKIEKQRRDLGELSLKKMKLLKAAIKAFVQSIMFRFVIKSKLKN